MEFEELFSHWIDRLNQGEMLDVDEIRKRCPDRADELIDMLREFEGLVPSDKVDGQTFGVYSIRGELGRGGMGIVYDAYESSLDRRVALKILPPGLTMSEKSLSRFQQEAKIVGKLKHPNIVQVYATGIEDGTPFIAMEYVGGEPLDQILNRKQQGSLFPKDQTQAVNDTDETVVQPQEALETAIIPELPAQDTQDETWSPIPSSPKDMDLGYCIKMAKLFQEVAEGLAHAHSRDIIHRDLKPSNLILEKETGKLRVLDFGLARVEGQESLTVSGEILGTPRYMSPEQASGDSNLDHRSDIYSLGATLYEVLTLSPVFEANSAHRTIEMILNREPRSPGKINPRIPNDLETIVMKCLRKRPQERYQTIESLAQDLASFTRGDPIKARPLSSWERCTRWLAKNYLKAASVVAIVVLLGVLSNFIIESNREGKEKAYDEFVNEAAVLLRRSEFYSGYTGLFAWDKIGYNYFAMTTGLGDLGTVNKVVKQAIDNLSQAIEIYPDRAEAYFYRGQSYFNIDELEKGEKDLLKAIELGFAPSAYFLANFKKFASEDEESQELSDKARELGESTYWSESWFQANIAMSNRDWKKADEIHQELFEKLRSKSEPYIGFKVNFYLNWGLNLLYLKEFEKAREKFATVQAFRPESTEPGLFKAMSFYLEGDNKKADEILESLYQETPTEEILNTFCTVMFARHKDVNRGLYWAEKLPTGFFRELWRSSFLGFSHRTTESYEVAKELPKLNPKAPLSWFLSALAHANVGDNKTAIQQLEEAKKLAPNSALPLIMLSNLNFQQSQIFFRKNQPAQGIPLIMKAQEFLTKAVEVEPDSSVAHYYLALAQSGRVPEEETLKGFEKVIELAATNTAFVFPLEQAYFNVGQIYIKRNELDSAIKNLEKSVEIGVEGKAIRSSWYLNLSQSYDKLNRPLKSLSTLEAGLTRFPVSRSLNAAYTVAVKNIFPDLPTYKAIDRFTNGELNQEQLEQFKAAHKDQKGSAKLAYFMGCMENKGSNFEPAFRHFIEARAHDPSSEEIILRLATAYRNVSRSLEAELELRQYLKNNCSDSRALWNLWIELCFLDLKKSLSSVAAIFPCRNAETEFDFSKSKKPVDDLWWLIHGLDNEGTVRINCGGGSYPAKGDHLAWGQDRFNQWGRIFLNGQGEYVGKIKLSPTTIQDERPFRSNRYFIKTKEQPFTAYQIPLAQGKYEVKLLLTELYFDVPEERVFSIQLEGKLIKENFSIGPMGETIEFVEEIEVTDGYLDVGFISHKDNPTINGIVITKL